MKSKQLFKKNQQVVGQVNDLTFEGQGVVKVEGFPFFVDGVIPGETVEINVMKVGKSYGFARLVRVIEPSPERVEVTDVIGRQIGTMTLQHIAYDAQLRYKQDMVRQAFKRLGGFEAVEVRPTIGMENPWQYRNKAQIPVRAVVGELTTGFFRKNSHQLVPVENFHIQHPEIDATILKVRDILREYGVTPYDEATGTGLVRHVIVRRGHYSGELMVILVVNGRRLPQEEVIVRQMVSQIPHVVSIILNQQIQKSNVIMGTRNRVLWGSAVYHDQMLGLNFSISPNSFYQVNTPQAERLYQCTIEAAALTGKETVLDAYCGIGTISLALAQHAKQVYAMEIVPEAIEMAKANAKTNGLDNVVFEAGKAEDWLPRWDDAGIQFDVVVVDPPRKGLDAQFIETLSQQSPERIVYVSCNPATCARDCKLFAEAGYALQWVQPVDLFAQTGHVECVVLIVRTEESME